MSGTSSLTHTYSYSRPSALRETEEGLNLALATSGGVTKKQGSETAAPYFFQGALVYPTVTAKALIALVKVVEARYAMNAQQLLMMKDPVVTSGGGYLRFEAFSGCCGVYGRVDLKPEAYDGVVTDQGTTNVDFNAPMRQALARISDKETVGFAIGEEEMTLLKGAEQVVEQKVKLPKRWLKGFVEVQAYLARMQPKYELDRIDAVRFLRALPSRSASKTGLYLKPVGRTLRFTPQPSKGAFKVNGAERLRLLDPLIPLAQKLCIYAEEDGETSTWQLDLGGQTFTLTISPENYRGFSGEGQVLGDIAQSLSTDLIEQVQGSLGWQSALRAEYYADEWELPMDQVRAAMGLLGSRGLVGYDVELTAYFHRVLPFDLSAIDNIHPRLVAAKKLLACEGLEIISNPDEPLLAEVRGTDVIHRVQQINDESYRCTCQWYSKYQGKRGLCKHIIAAQIATQTWTEA